MVVLAIQSTVIAIGVSYFLPPVLKARATEKQSILLINVEQQLIVENIATEVLPALCALYDVQAVVVGSLSSQICSLSLCKTGMRIQITAYIC